MRQDPGVEDTEEKRVRAIGQVDHMHEQSHADGSFLGVQRQAAEALCKEVVLAAGAYGSHGGFIGEVELPSEFG